MKVTQAGLPSRIVDVICDMCGVSTRIHQGAPQYGTMHAAWGKGTSHCGDEYELHLCELCFFNQVASIKRMRWSSAMFEEEGDAILADDGYGRVR